MQPPRGALLESRLEKVEPLAALEGRVEDTSLSTALRRALRVRALPRLPRGLGRECGAEAPTLLLPEDLWIMRGQDWWRAVRSLQIAGREEAIFSPDAVELVYRYSGGIPRKVNNICDIALVIGSSSKLESIDGDWMQRLIQSESGNGT